MTMECTEILFKYRVGRAAKNGSYVKGGLAECNPPKP